MSIASQMAAMIKDYFPPGWLDDYETPKHEKYMQAVKMKWLKKRLLEDRQAGKKLKVMPLPK